MRFEISEILKQEEVMSLVFGNCAVPKNLLGRHIVKNGQVFSAYHPDAVAMNLIDHKGEIHPMDRIERQHIFAIYFPTLRPFDYKIEMTFSNGHTFVNEDPYSFESMITKREEEEFLAGRWYDSYRKLGAHPMTINGVKGTYFAVWAPSAKRVSIVGNFNFWNGLMYPMNRLSDSGIFELFLPGVDAGAIYKFEVKTQDGRIFQKRDPYGVAKEGYSGNASRIFDIYDYQWKDHVWMTSRNCKDWSRYPIEICDIGLCQEGLEELEKELFDESYTHLLLSVNAGKNEKDMRTVPQSGLYTPMFCECEPDAMRDLIDKAHQNNMGVLMEISFECFASGAVGLEMFDGSSLYGYPDNRKGIKEKSDMYRFCYDKPGVINYLISNLMFWIREYHIDGFVFEGRMNDEEVEKSERIINETVRQVRAVDRGILLIADDKTALRGRNSGAFAESLGFDFYWNYDLKCGIDTYLATPEPERYKEFFRLTLPTYASSIENSVMAMNHRSASMDQSRLLQDITEENYKILAEERMSCAYLIGLPGRKVWFYNKNIHESLREYRRALNDLYHMYPALYTYNGVDIPMEWINPSDAMSGVVSFIRGSRKEKNRLLVICNFGGTSKHEFMIGVPEYADYKLIFNSDWDEFGGRSEEVALTITSKRKNYDLRPYSLSVTIPAYTTLIFRF